MASIFFVKNLVAHFEKPRGPFCLAICYMAGPASAREARRALASRCEAAKRVRRAEINEARQGWPKWPITFVSTKKETKY